MIYTKDLFEVIFNNFNENSDEFIVISGWLGFTQIERILKSNKKITALFGMSASSGVPAPNHNKLRFLDATEKNLEIYYALPGNDVHSKIYVWKSKGIIKKALIGSANFTYQGLYSPERELLMTVNPSEFKDLDKYLKSILYPTKIERCSNPTLITRISSVHKTLIFDPNELIIDGSVGNVKTIRLTLLDRQGKVPDISGLNWGQGVKAHTKPNDVYIKISSAAIRTGFFKPKSYERMAGLELEQTKKYRIPVEVIWDDGTAMDCLEEGDQTVNRILYPKQIASAYSKEILGSYLRKRLGVPSGQKVTIEDLKKHGRTYIDITKTGENNYYMDFGKLKSMSG